MHTFEVSDVPLCSVPLAPVTRDASMRRRMRAPFEACGCNLANLIECEKDDDRREEDFDAVPGHPGNDLHPFLGAVHYAFAKHYPLILSPDDVWLCIAQGLALHVDANAEALRGRFVRHEGKEKIEICRDGFVKGSPNNDWPGCFAEFSDRIAEHVGKKRDLVVADFSTTGPVEKAASEIVLMAALKHYFDFSVLTMCGIPRVTLLGTEEDWRSIRRRAAVLAELDLGWWVDALVPLLDELVAAASGQPNRKLWQSLYKMNDGSGGPWVTGWINVLFPYIDMPGFDPATEKPTKERRRNRSVTSWARGFQAEEHGGPGADNFPSGLSTAPFTWKYLGTPLPMELTAGFVGVSQDKETLAVRPVIGWAVGDAPR